MHQALLSCPLLEGVTERLDHPFSVQAFMNMMPHDFSRVRIGDHAQVSHTRLCR